MDMHGCFSACYSTAVNMCSKSSVYGVGNFDLIISLCMISELVLMLHGTSRVIQQVW